MRYDKSIDNQKNWIVEEENFDVRYLGKCESIMSQGNGYMGIRASTEESYLGEVRNTFISGTFNRFDDNEVSEIPNAADVIQMDIYIDGIRMNIAEGNYRNYSRFLNLKTGELVRKFVWEGPNGEEVDFTFRRVVSLSNLHVVAQKIEIVPLKDINLTMESGINAQVTNTGVQHFSEGEKRLFYGKYLHLKQKTTQSNIDFIVNSCHNFNLDGNEIFPNSIILMDRRKVYFRFNQQISAGSTFTIEKISTYHTSRDKEFEGVDLHTIVNSSLDLIKKESEKGYKKILDESSECWDEEVWGNAPIIIESIEEIDQLAIRFAQYHLRIMTPFHDNRMSIAAKGLSGEGYKGHVFWDTEIFILPYYTFTNPKVARNLLEYRFKTLNGARKKARDNGYEGAMFPWESAWMDDGEVTPVWGAADIITGEATKIWSGFIEQHISSDISYAIWQYYEATGDQNFMDLYGYELIFDIATFWASRAEWDSTKEMYEIKNVIGPDEYKEHVDNNAFTNYMAKWSLDLAIKYYGELKDNEEQLFNKLNKSLKIQENFYRWKEVSNKMYLPKPTENLVIPQDDTYLCKKIIDLYKYKNQEQVGSIFEDYNLEQINGVQVSKQADVILLLYLLEQLFDNDVKKANWAYYEPKTLHDSSLSLSTHSILASDLGDKELAYKLFKKALEIDLGGNMKSSDHGIHAGSIGGIWQCVVNGFGGVRLLDGVLRIEPNIPDNWQSLMFTISIRNDKIKIHATHHEVVIEKLTNNNDFLNIFNKGKKYVLIDKLVIKK